MDSLVMNLETLFQNGFFILVSLKKDPNQRYTADKLI